MVAGLGRLLVITSEAGWAVWRWGRGVGWE